MEKIAATNSNEEKAMKKVVSEKKLDWQETAMSRKRRKGQRKCWRQEKVGMATDSDRLERAKHWEETADDR